MHTGSTKGTDTALCTLVNMIESSILRKEFCLVVSVDIQGAFDKGTGGLVGIWTPKVMLWVRPLTPPPHPSLTDNVHRISAFLP